MISSPSNERGSISKVGALCRVSGVLFVFDLVLLVSLRLVHSKEMYYIASPRRLGHELNFLSPLRLPKQNSSESDKQFIGAFLRTMLRQMTGNRAGLTPENIKEAAQNYQINLSGPTPDCSI